MFSKLINVTPTPALGYPLCCQKVTSVFCAYILHQENPTPVELQTLRDVTSQIFLHPAFKDLERQRLQTQAIYPCGVFSIPLKRFSSCLTQNHHYCNLSPLLLALSPVDMEKSSLPPSLQQSLTYLKTVIMTVSQLSFS